MLTQLCPLLWRLMWSSFCTYIYIYIYIFVNTSRFSIQETTPFVSSTKLFSSVADSSEYLQNVTGCTSVPPTMLFGSRYLAQCHFYLLQAQYNYRLVSIVSVYSLDIITIIIIIIIIIWHYNLLWVFAFSAKSLQVLPSLAVSFQFLTFSIFRSSMTSSCHRCLGLATALVPIGLQSSSFLVGLA